MQNVEQADFEIQLAKTENALSIKESLLIEDEDDGMLCLALRRLVENKLNEDFSPNSPIIYYKSKKEALKIMSSRIENWQNRIVAEQSERVKFHLRESAYLQYRYFLNPNRNYE